MGDLILSRPSRKYNLKMSSPRITRALLHESIRSQDLSSMLELLPSMASEEINGGMEEDGNTALHVAVKHNNVNAVEELVKVEGVDINAANNEGETPVMVAVGYLHQEVISILLKDLRVNLDDLEDYIGKCVEGWEDAKEAVKMMVEEEMKRRAEMMEEKEEMMQLTQDERNERNAVEVEADKKGLRERVKAKLDPAHIKSKLDKDHIKSKLDPAHIKSKLGEKFSKTKLDHLKQKMGGRTAGAEENNE